MKIKKINEVIDSDNNLIGYDDIPRAGGGLESQASSTTDYNAKISRQPFRYDMLGRFGFTLFPFFEGENSDENMEKLDEVAGLMYETYKKTLEHYYKNPNKLKPDYRKLSNDDGYIPEALKDIGKNLEETFNKFITKEDKNIDESSVHEDRVVKEKSKKWIEKKSKDGEVLSGDVKRAVDLMAKMDMEDINQLIKVLET